jgi:hypothetical protein
MMVTECGSFWEVCFLSPRPIEEINQLIKDEGFKEGSFSIFFNPYLIGKVAVFFKADGQLSAEHLKEIFAKI